MRARPVPHDGLSPRHLPQLGAVLVGFCFALPWSTRQSIILSFFEWRSKILRDACIYSFRLSLDGSFFGIGRACTVRTCSANARLNDGLASRPNSCPHSEHRFMSPWETKCGGRRWGIMGKHTLPIFGALWRQPIGFSPTDECHSSS